MTGSTGTKEKLYNAYGVPGGKYDAGEDGGPCGTSQLYVHGVFGGGGHSTTAGDGGGGDGCGGGGDGDGDGDGGGGQSITGGGGGGNGWHGFSHSTHIVHGTMSFATVEVAWVTAETVAHSVDTSKRINEEDIKGNE
ncbi:loricrin-like [Abrus precatorius]|uniref:Loricrin-like n=1 Tax=Abrus precatorius TaxID=3816 RepID=A0A8B8KZR1_ABRPR|nr:loricrin-like [Abrus precatorius]